MKITEYNSIATSNIIGYFYHIGINEHVLSIVYLCKCTLESPGYSFARARIHKESTQLFQWDFILQKWVNPFCEYGPTWLFISFCLVLIRWTDYILTLYWCFWKSFQTSTYSCMIYNVIYSKHWILLLFYNMQKSTYDGFTFKSMQAFIIHLYPLLIS